MNRLSVRLVLSHLLVAVLSALATFVIVRQLAPALFDETLRRAQAGGARGPGQGFGQNAGLREQRPQARLHPGRLVPHRQQQGDPFRDRRRVRGRDAQTTQVPAGVHGADDRERAAEHGRPVRERPGGQSRDCHSSQV